MSNLENWKQLHEYGKKFRDMKPWKKLSNTDIICLRFSEHEECYISVMGNGDIEYGFMLTYGKDARYEIKKLMHAAYDPSVQAILGAEINALNMFISDKEEITPEQRDIIKQLGITYKGKNWIYFETYEAGYVPSICSDKEVAKLLKYFPKLLEALTIFMQVKRHCLFDFEQVFIYENMNGIWDYEVQDFSSEDFDWKKTLFNNEIQANKLLKKKHNGHCWEYGMLCLPDIIEDKKYKKPVISKMSVLADKTEDNILDSRLWTPEDKSEDVLEEIANYMVENGKPKIIHVGSAYSAAFLEDFCEKTEIDLEIGDLSTVNEFLSTMYDNDISEDELEALEEIMENAGIDINEYRKLAQNLSYEEFEKELLPELLGAFTDMDFDDEDCDLFDDYDLNDDMYEVDEIEGREEKLKAIHEFYQSKQKDKTVDFDMSILDISEVVEEATTEEIYQQLDEIGVLVNPASRKKTLEKMLLTKLKKELPYILTLLSQKERQLFELIYFETDDFDSEIKFSKFKYDEQTVAKLVQWNLIDVAFATHAGHRVMILQEIDDLIII